MTSIVKEEQPNTVSTDTIPPPSSPEHHIEGHTIIKHIKMEDQHHEKINACIQNIVIEKRKNSITNEEDISSDNNSNNNSNNNNINKEENDTLDDEKKGEEEIEIEKTTVNNNDNNDNNNDTNNNNNNDDNDNNNNDNNNNDHNNDNHNNDVYKEETIETDEEKPPPLSITTSLLTNTLCPYIQVTIPEIGASRDGSYMLYTLFVSLPHLRRSWTVSRRYNEFLELDKVLKRNKIEKKRDNKTFFDCSLPPKTPFYANKTDARLTRNRRRQLEAYLWERVYEESVKNCRELALFLAPHLLWVDDSDINGVNGLYVEREDRVGNANIYTRTAHNPSTTMFTLKREKYIPDSDDDDDDEDSKYSSPQLSKRLRKKINKEEDIYYWELETELYWGGKIQIPLYANRSTTNDIKPPEDGWLCCEELDSKYSNHTIVCRYNSPWIEWKDILDAIVTLPVHDDDKTHDEMLRDIMKPNFRSGNLKKLGRVRKNWLERFFVLDFNTGSLEYYTIDGAKLKGCLDITGCEIKIQSDPPSQPDGSVRFVINTIHMEGNRTLKLEASSKATAIGWVESIQNIAIRHVIQEESRKRFRIHSGEGSRSKDDGDELE